MALYKVVVIPDGAKSFGSFTGFGRVMKEVMRGMHFDELWNFGERSNMVKRKKRDSSLDSE